MCCSCLVHRLCLCVFSVQKLDFAELAATQWELGSDLASDYEEDREMEQLMDERYDGVGLSDGSDAEMESDSASEPDGGDSNSAMSEDIGGSKNEDSSASKSAAVSHKQTRTPLWLLQLQEGWSCGLFFKYSGIFLLVFV